MYEIREISFEAIKNYWIEQKHFHVKNKKINERVYTLGPYECTIEKPKVQAYGLFVKEKMIGVVQIQEWAKSTIRWRTINIIPAYRGNDLGWYLLNNVIYNYWREYDIMFGWCRENIFHWTIAHNFKKFDDVWHNHDETTYIAMVKNIQDLKRKCDV